MKKTSNSKMKLGGKMKGSKLKNRPMKLAMKMKRKKK